MRAHHGVQGGAGRRACPRRPEPLPHPARTFPPACPAHARQAFVLANRLNDATLLSTELFEVFYGVLRGNPEVADAGLADICAVRERVSNPLAPGGRLAARPSSRKRKHRPRRAHLARALPTSTAAALTTPPHTHTYAHARNRTLHAAPTARLSCISRASTPSRRANAAAWAALASLGRCVNAACTRAALPCLLARPPPLPTRASRALRSGSRVRRPLPPTPRPPRRPTASRMSCGSAGGG